MDFGGALQPATFPTVIRQNPKITTHAGQKPPWGYVDWWPISLYVNNDVKPFDDKDVRWAISHYIDRQQLIEVGVSRCLDGVRPCRCRRTSRCCPISMR